jgi:hypothetical protein
MAIYIIKNESNEEINRIVANKEFVEANYAGRYEEAVPARNPIPPEASARLWRNEELEATDFIVPLSDHPQQAAYMTYRAALRDWPSTSDFPDTRPTLGS